MALTTPIIANTCFSFYLQSVLCEEGTRQFDSTRVSIHFSIYTCRGVHVVLQPLYNKLTRRQSVQFDKGSRCYCLKVPVLMGMEHWCAL